ncbi:MAG TPA: hypothetical protein VJV78_32025 [Polyangiales bacterium]|nr:hypothetical protein [Polyangiales bacterium]
MRQGPSPLVGYNTNVRHKGKLYHIQTEDSGVNHPHVITHLFADGGRIIASRKTGYAEHLGARDLQGIVKKLMQDQHKSMFIELRDCVYDEDGAAEQNARSTVDHPAANSQKPADAAAASSRSSTAAARPPSKPMDIDALERAAEARMAESPVARSRNEPRRGVGRYQQTLPAQPKHLSRPPPAASIFGGEVLRGKSLDEVILSYLSDDIGESER